MLLKPDSIFWNQINRVLYKKNYQPNFRISETYWSWGSKQRWVPLLCDANSGDRTQTSNKQTTSKHRRTNRCHSCRKTAGVDTAWALHTSPLLHWTCQIFSLKLFRIHAKNGSLTSRMDGDSGWRERLKIQLQCYQRNSDQRLYENSISCWY